MNSHIFRVQTFSIIWSFSGQDKSAVSFSMFNQVKTFLNPSLIMSFFLLYKIEKTFFNTSWISLDKIAVLYIDDNLIHFILKNKILKCLSEPKLHSNKKVAIHLLILSIRLSFLSG